MSTEEKKEETPNGEQEKKEETPNEEAKQEGEKKVEGDHCDCGHDHDHHEKEDHCGCGHDHGHPKRSNKRPKRPRRQDDEPAYQPPPPPELHVPQREPLMIDPLPKFDLPESKVLDDGKVDCVGNDPGKVVKTVVKKGIDNKQMHLNTRAKVHFVGTFDDGTKFASTRDKNEEFTYLYGKHEVIPGFDIALSTMRTGEIADVVIHPDYAYGSKVFDNIPANSVLHFNIELVSYEWEPIEPMDQIEYAGEKREEGNEKAKEGKWQEAVDIYQKGYNFVEVLMIGDPGQHKMGQDMKLAIALNKAHCYLKLNQPEEALKMCTDALKVDPASVKGKFRRGLCYKAMQDYYRAESDFKSALVSAPNDKAIKAELAQLRTILEPLERAQRERFQKKSQGKNIFEQMKEEEEKEKIIRKERELKRIEQEKEEEELRRLRKEKEDKEKAEKEKEEKEKAEKEKVEKEKEDTGKEKGGDGIVKEPENTPPAAAVTTTVAASTEELVKEDEKTN